MEDPQWIVKILLCEGGNVEQWLKLQNISWCLCLNLSLSTLFSLYILYCYFCSYPYMLDIVCVLTQMYSTKRAIEAPQLIIQRNREESSRALHGKFGLTLSYTLCVSVKVFNFILFVIRLALYLFTPSRCIFTLNISIPFSLVTNSYQQFELTNNFPTNIMCP